MNTLLCAQFCCHMCVLAASTRFCSRSILCLSVGEMKFDEFYTNTLPADNWV